MWSEPVALTQDVDTLILDCQALNSNETPDDLTLKLNQLSLLLSS